MKIRKSINETVRRTDYPTDMAFHRRLAIVGDQVARALNLPPEKVIIRGNTNEAHWYVEASVEEVVQELERELRINERER